MQTPRIMTDLLDIIIAPDPMLKQVAQKVENVDDDVRKQLDRMLATMYDAPGIGLAANQVGMLNRVIVVDVAGEGEEPTPFQMINPEILWASDEKSVYNEGCLSLPEQYAEIERPAQVRIGYVDYNGKEQQVEADGLLATCLQHEIDHLNGLLFIDHISALRRNMILKKMKKLKKQSIL